MKIRPMNRMVLVDKIGSAEQDGDKLDMEALGLSIPKSSSMNKKFATTSGKYLFKVLASNNPTIKEGSIALSDAMNMQELNFLLNGKQYNLVFIDEIDILALFDE